ncbi:MAG: hypothetical protein KUG79_14010 [Pseudomonadales bacterium]|nr:hypothetical protein [Pseudomonadales bacterium]
MKKYLSFIIPAVLFSHINTAVAEEVSDYLKIVRFHATNSDGSFCIYSENNENWVTNDMCPGNYRHVACTSPATTNNNMKSSIALAASVAGKAVQIQASACCGTSVPCITEISIQP